MFLYGWRLLYIAADRYYHRKVPASTWEDPASDDPFVFFLSGFTSHTQKAIEEHTVRSNALIFTFMLLWTAMGACWVVQFQHTTTFHKHTHCGLKASAAGGLVLYNAIGLVVSAVISLFGISGKKRTVRHLSFSRYLDDAVRQHMLHHTQVKKAVWDGPVEKDDALPEYTEIGGDTNL